MPHARIGDRARLLQILERHDQWRATKFRCAEDYFIFPMVYLNAGEPCRQAIHFLNWNAAAYGAMIWAVGFKFKESSHGRG